MKIFFGNTLVENDEVLSFEDAQMNFNIDLNLQRDKFYTLILFDLDAPHPNYTHYLLVNLTRKNHAYEVIPYLSPRPPPNDKKHRYVVELYEQPSYLKEIIHVNRSNAVKWLDGKKFPIADFSTSFYVLGDNDPRKVKFCDCVLDVSSKGDAYNPYAVCAKSVGTTSRNCKEILKSKLDQLPLDKLQSYAKLYKYPVRKTVESQLRAIR
jgi:hypothetical protein